MPSEHDFLIELVGDGGRYGARVQSPAGEDSTIVFLDPTGLIPRGGRSPEQLGPGVGIRDLAVSSEGHESDPRAVGAALFDAVFADRVSALFLASRNQIERRDERLRVVLRLPADLAVLPWELLFDSRRREYLGHRCGIVRYVDAPEPVRPLTTDPPVRVLAMVALPGDMPPLDAAAERRSLVEALTPIVRRGLVRLDWVDGPRWSDAQTSLHGGCHVFHFIGHGLFHADRAEGLVAFADDDGRRHLVSPAALAGLLSLATPSPRLVVLNSCSTAASSPLNPYSSIGAFLARSVPAVVAMQLPINDAAAKVFAGAFYRSLVHDGRVDEAVRAGRITIVGHPTGTVEWATPVLYTHSRDRHLFRFPGQRSPSGEEERPPASYHITNPGQITGIVHGDNATVTMNFAADQSTDPSSGRVGVQAGPVHGGAPVHRVPPSTRVPRQLLFPSPNFVNREAELSFLTSMLDDAGPGLVVLAGPGGVGKTALAMRWGHLVRDRFPDGQLYVDLRGFGGNDPLAPTEVLDRFLRALGVSTERVGEIDEQMAQFRTVTSGRSLLVVLDNAFSAAQVRQLLPAAGSSMVVVTSRRRLDALVLDGARLLDVPPLTARDSLALLNRAVGGERIGREPDEAEQLAALCGGFPIALCVAAARLAVRPRLSVGRMVVDLSEPDRLGALSGVDGAVRAAFDASYRSLSAEAGALYRRLALHPGPDFGYGPVGALMPTLGSTAAAGASVNAVAVLLDASLLQEVDEDRFRFHDLVRLHARERADVDDTAQGRADAVLAMAEWYRAAAARADAVVTPYRRRLLYRPTTTLGGLPELSSQDEALAWLEQERGNLVAAGAAALEHGRAELAWQLCDVMWPLLLYRKHYRQRLEIDARGVEAAHRWGNVWAEADMLKRLGLACTAAGDFDNGRRHLDAAMRRYDEVGDARGRLDAQEGLARLARDRGEPDLAVETFLHVLAGNRELGDDRATGLTLIHLGTLLPKMGRAAEAIEFLAETRRLFARLSQVDPYNEARVTSALASAYLSCGDLPAAEQAATAAAERMRELGSEYEYADAQSLLGQVAQRRDNREQARRHYRLALDIFTALGSPRARVVDRQLADLDHPSA